MERGSVAHEVEALSRVKDTDAIACILRKLDVVAESAGKTVPLNEANWEQKTAHAQGMRDGMLFMKNWLIGRKEGYFNDEGNPVLGRTSYPGVNGRNEHGEARPV